MNDIQNAVLSVRDAANACLNRFEQDDEPWVTLAGIQDLDGSAVPAAQNRIVMAIYHIEVSADSAGPSSEQAPAGRGEVDTSSGDFAHTDVHFLFYANFPETAGAGLTALSRLAGLPELLRRSDSPGLLAAWRGGQGIFVADTAGFGDEAGAVAREGGSVLTLENKSFAEVTHIMGSLGLRYRPSLFFRLRVFPGSITGVATAVPVFIGYTEFARDPSSGIGRYNVPVEIASMEDFERHFGGAAETRYCIVEAGPGQGISAFRAHVRQESEDAGQEGGGSPAPVARRFVAARRDARFVLHQSVKLFFAHGGKTCFVVSVGSYWSGQLPETAADTTGWPAGAVTKEELLYGLEVAGAEVGPTVIVVPDLCMLEAASDYAEVACKLLEQASELQDRVALLDLPGCMTATSIDALVAAREALGAALAPRRESLSYGVAYGPALKTQALPMDDVLLPLRIVADDALMRAVLTTQAETIYAGDASLPILLDAVNSVFVAASIAPGAERRQGPRRSGAALARAADDLLSVALPIYGHIKTSVFEDMRIVPVSGAIAGCWARHDTDVAVWTPLTGPAILPTLSPLVDVPADQARRFDALTDGGTLNIVRPVADGGAALRSAHTLDSGDRVYGSIAVRRTLIFIDQSIRAALSRFVFAPNSPPTWVAVEDLVSRFLLRQWRLGCLSGDRPSRAFTVQCGLGSTMTADDVQNGRLIVELTLQFPEPCGLVELTLTQEVQGVS